MRSTFRGREAALNAPPINSEVVMDQPDRAQQEHDLHLSLQLKHRKPTVPVTGYCAWCAENAPKGAQFCSPECGEDFAQDQRRRG